MSMLMLGVRTVENNENEKDKEEDRKEKEINRIILVVP